MKIASPEGGAPTSSFHFQVNEGLLSFTIWLPSEHSCTSALTSTKQQHNMESAHLCECVGKYFSDAEVITQSWTRFAAKFFIKSMALIWKNAVMQHICDTKEIYRHILRILPTEGKREPVQLIKAKLLLYIIKSA